MKTTNTITTRVVPKSKIHGQQFYSRSNDILRHAHLDVVKFIIVFVIFTYNLFKFVIQYIYIYIYIIMCISIKIVYN